MLHLQTRPEAQQSFQLYFPPNSPDQRMCSLVEQKEPMTMAKQKERMWIQYAYHRATTFPEMWRNLLQQIDCQAFLEEPMLLELINETLIENIIQKKFVLTTPLAVNQSILSKDDENILRYACTWLRCNEAQEEVCKSSY